MLRVRELAEFNRIVTRLERLYPTLPGKAATIAINFTKERFREGGWRDSSLEKWDERKRQDNGARNNRGVLMDTGALKRSIRKGIVTPTRAKVLAGGYGIGYAQIHNEGGTVSGTAKVRTHQRRAFARTRAGRQEQVRAHRVSAYTRRFSYTMPKRQFLGDSFTLERDIQRMLIREIHRAIT